ncbi:MAG: riboflavin synthase [Acutalibacteraceae bacterium]|nr:riboflavin synthase [Acutalibacteraceae bacterium]
MFTGLVEEVGTLQGMTTGSKKCVLTIGCSTVLEDTKIGDSIMTNGVCLTVTSMGSRYFTADVMNESLSRSDLGVLRPGSPVNLERAMPLNGRFGGHIVSGHIDGVGTVSAIEEDDNAVWFTIKAEPQVLRYIVEKGSIAIDGISLTVAYVDDRCFKVSLIPHTRAVTNLASKRVGTPVNLENDVIGKYVEKFLKGGDAPAEKDEKTSGLTMESLIANGF